MRRTERLFQIIQILRRRRRMVTGRELADELDVSLRTLYRDIAELVAQRVPIRGEAGAGYLLDSDFDMPPLMLTADELEAAVLGAAWVAQRGDPALSRGAQDLIAKLTEVVPAHLRPVLLDASLRPMSFRRPVEDVFDGAEVRAAIRDRRKLQIAYNDVDDNPTERTVWPVSMGYMDDRRIVAAWCELRQDFRHFRTDRIVGLTVKAEQYPLAAAVLRRRWEAHMRDCASERRAAFSATRGSLPAESRSL
jgi:predicted DNA-binding transcriptional regulator YafY